MRRRNSLPAFCTWLMLAFALSELLIRPLTALADSPGLGKAPVLSAAANLPDRRQTLLDAAAADFQHSLTSPDKHEMWAVQALFLLGRTNDGLKFADLALDRLDLQQPINAGFTYWPAMDCYLRWNALFPPALKAKFKDKLTQKAPYKAGTTANERLMGAVARFLATEAWGATAFAPDAWFRQNDPTGGKFIRSVLEHMVFSGPPEFASRPYGSHNLLPILSLAELSQDPVLRNQAQIAFEVALAQLAPVYLAGHLGVTTTRSYTDLLSQQPGGLTSVLWFYFGGATPGSLIRAPGLDAAVMNYRPPALLTTAATDRRQAFTHRAWLNDRHMYSFVNRQYILFSQSAKGIRIYGQVYPSGVMWEDSDFSRHSFLWICNPVADDNDEWLVAPRKIHTHGASNYEQQLQRQHTLVSVYAIPADYRFPYVLGFVPGGYEAVIDDSQSQGRIFLHYQTVLIALSASQPFAWDRSAGIRAPAAKPAPGDSEFRLMATNAGMAIETALPGEFPGASAQERLQAFRALVLAKSNPSLLAGSQPAMRYTDRFGTVLQVTFDGADTLNGEAVDYAHWPGLENPWMHQPYQGNLTITDGKTVRTYDLATWKVTEVRDAADERPPPDWRH